MAETSFLITGIFLGGVIAWLFMRAKLARNVAGLQSEHARELAAAREGLKAAEARVEELRAGLQDKETAMDELRRELSTEKSRRVEAVTKLESSEKSLTEQKHLIETMKKELTDTFNALSSAALKSSSEDFLRLATEQLGKIVAETKGKLGEHQASMKGLVKPLHEALKRYEEQIHSIESIRRQDYGSLNQQLKALMSTHQQLQQETSRLVTALRKPQVSGSWGQLSLKRTAELAGMTANCDFFEQESVNTETGRLRPDMVVRLPNEREIVVDAKAPVDAYLKVISSATEEERRAATENYVSQVRAHLNALGSKAYWDQFKRSPEMVVMFLPGESFFSAAIEHDPSLIEDGSIKKVILATPTTLIALLKAIAYGWQQAELTKHAQEISRLGKELYERFAVAMEHFSKTGTHLEKAVESYNQGVRSVESRLLHSVRRFKELGISSRKEVPRLEEIDERPRGIDIHGP
ncbi:MAG TPA: DNA recombination protein RmuC [Nitrospirae bacterium]|nr:DNA recombination protein RmuC [Nitrospirota bacterium]